MSALDDRFVLPSTDPVRQRAAEALENVHPPLYRFLADIVLDAALPELAEVYAVALQLARDRVIALEAEIRLIEANPGTILMDRMSARIAELETEIVRIRRAVGKESTEIEQMCADLFPEEFPEYPPEWQSAERRCVGDHVPWSMVKKVCDEVVRLRAENERLYGEISDLEPDLLAGGDLLDDEEAGWDGPSG